MAFRAKTYPYPVLSSFSGDYEPQFNFDVSFDLTVNKASNTVSVVASWDDASMPATLVDRLISGDAVVAVNVECASTLTRRVVELDAERSCKLELDQLLGDIELTALIINKTSAEFKPPVNDEINKDFTGASAFELQAGDPLAIADPWTQNLEFQGKKSDSLLQLTFTDERSDNTYAVRTDEKYLRVIAGSHLKPTLSLMWSTKELKPTFAMSIAKDAILTGLLTLVNDEGDPDLEWKSVLTDKLESLNKFGPYEYEFEEANELAQLIIEKSGIEKLVANVK